jgi:glycosyltransferase involved in cell wall biosynthesis
MAVPYVATIHGGDIFTLRGRILRLFKRAALRLSDAVTVNSRATEGAVRAMGVKLSMLVRIPMGVKTRHSIVIGTKLGGVTDAVVKKTGLLVNAGVPEELAEAISRLRNEPRLREQISSKVKSVVQQRFSREVSAKCFSTVFQQLSAWRSRKQAKNTSTAEK